MSRTNRWLALLFPIALLNAAPSVAQLTIAPTFDASITGSLQAASIEDAIGKTVASYHALFADPLTVNILFRYAPTAPNGTALSPGLLARSNYVVYAPVWSTFANALTADATTTNDASAIATLPAAPLARDLEYSSADGRAVGLTAPGTMTATSTVGTGTFDGIVTLNSAKPFDFDRSDGIGTGEFDAVRMFEHEIDEVLGLGSILPATSDFRGGTAYRPEDLFRYAATGVRSLSTSGSDASYFSIDGGATDLVGFNQNGSDDYGDWLSPACAPAPARQLVQYAFTCPGSSADITAASPEAVALDVIGYNLVTPITTPEPGTFGLMALGIVLLAAGYTMRGFQCRPA